MAIVDRISVGATSEACTDGQHYACGGTAGGIECGCGCHFEAADGAAA